MIGALFFFLGLMLYLMGLFQNNKKITELKQEVTNLKEDLRQAKEERDDAEKALLDYVCGMTTISVKCDDTDEKKAKQRLKSMLANEVAAELGKPDYFNGGYSYVFKVKKHD